MPKHLFEANGDWTVGFEAMHDPGYRVLTWQDSGEDDGDFGGGTLQVFSNIEGVITPVADSKITSSSVDGNGEQLQQLILVTGGSLIVRLTGATDPNLQVAVR